jgi:hypothetical protein
MDYKEIFAIVAKMTTIHTLIVIASVRQWHIPQLDLKGYIWAEFGLDLG